MTPTKRIVFLALGVMAIDQLSKSLVLNYLDYAQEKVVIEGFFKFVHWGNTGAAWSLFKDNNGLLAIVSIVAIIILFFSRHHFASGTYWGQTGLGLLFGGIMGNLYDRLHENRQHVIDFIYFYVNRSGGRELGFPAFNIADSAICIGVVILFLLSWQNDRHKTSASPSSAQTIQTQDQ